VRFSVLRGEAIENGINLVVGHRQEFFGQAFEEGIKRTCKVGQALGLDSGLK
jgi:hypothetical protein